MKFPSWILIIVPCSPWNIALGAGRCCRSISGEDAKLQRWSLGFCRHSHGVHSWAKWYACALPHTCCYCEALVAIKNRYVIYSEFSILWKRTLPVPQIIKQSPLPYYWYTTLVFIYSCSGHDGPAICVRAAVRRVCCPAPCNAAAVRARSCIAVDCVFRLCIHRSPFPPRVARPSYRHSPRAQCLASLSPHAEAKPSAAPTYRPRAHRAPSCGDSGDRQSLPMHAGLLAIFDGPRLPANASHFNARATARRRQCVAQPE